jgi:hypothetical protein
VLCCGMGRGRGSGLAYSSLNARSSALHEARWLFLGEPPESRRQQQVGAGESPSTRPLAARCHCCPCRSSLHFPQNREYWPPRASCRQSECASQQPRTPTSLRSHQRDSEPPHHLLAPAGPSRLLHAPDIAHCHGTLARVCACAHVRARASTRSNNKASPQRYMPPIPRRQQLAWPMPETS